MSKQFLEKAKEEWNEAVKFLSSNSLTDQAIKERAHTSELKISNLSTDEVEKSNLGRLVDIFDQINFTDPQKSSYRDPLSLKNDGQQSSPDSLRGGLTNLIENIEKRNYFKGVPTDPEQKEKFYDDLEKVMRHIVLEFNKKLDSATNQEEVMDEIQSHVLVLAEGGWHCGARWKSEAMQLYGGLRQGWEKTLTGLDNIESLRHIIDQFKLNIVEKMALSASDVSHGYLNVVRELGENGYLLPGFEEANYKDPLGHVGKIYDVVETFTQNCSSFKVVNFVKSRLNEWVNDPKKRDPAMAMLNEIARADKILSKDLNEMEQSKEKAIGEIRKRKDEQTPLTEKEKNLLESLTQPGNLDINTKKEIERIIEKKADHVMSLQVTREDVQIGLKLYLNAKGFSVLSFDEQMEKVGINEDAKINEKINEWLIKEGIIKVIEDETTGVDLTEITFQGTASILKHFNFIKTPDKPNIVTNMKKPIKFKPN